MSLNRDSYAAMVTAVDFDAPPILQWDTPEHRNPVSWYLYSGNSLPDAWGLIATTYQSVTGICFKPTMWHGNFSHHGEGVVFILDGARDTRYENAGGGLFPEIMKSEFRDIRSTIEAYSRKETLQGYEESTACGIALSKGDVWSNVFRVLVNGSKTEYKLDRWD